MATAYGPSIVRDGLVLALDAANRKSLPPTLEVLVVAGGGAGGGYHGGGGGGGGVVYDSEFFVTPGIAITVTVGAGGTAATAGGNTGDPGNNSVFGTIIALGGGAGLSQSNSPQSRNNGGSGGGASDGDAGVLHSGGTGTAGQGFGGGSIFGNGPSQIILYATAGGGGAGGAGTGPVSTSGGAGGPGLPFNISGSLQYYGGGGGGTQLGTGTGSAAVATYGLGGSGGGGNGGYTGSAGGAAIRSSVSGVAGTGGGGGGYLYSGHGGGAGGSGIVIVRYAGSQRATGGTVTSAGGYTIHTFTTVGSSSFTLNAASPVTNTWVDLSGRNNNGTLINGVGYSSTNGGSLVYGGAGDYIDCGTGGSLTLGNNGPFTASAWIRITTLKSFSGIISKVQSDRGGVYSFMCTAHNDGTLAFYNNAAWYYSTNAGITTNTWYNVVFSFNSSVLSYYVNGVAYGTSTLTWPETTAHKVFIGSWYSINTSYDFAGNISNAQLHNRALSAGEVAQNFNALRGRFGV